MNPFEKHGIKHLSPSSLNLYRDEPAFWTMRYLHKFKDNAGPSAWRGSAVEAGVDCFLLTGSMDQAIVNAGVSYTRDLHRYADDNDGEIPSKDEQPNIKPILEQAMPALPDAPFLARQIKVETWIDGIEIPVIGYVDYSFEDFDLDLKTTLRLPSLPRPPHCRQVSVYGKARKKPQKLLYCTPKKHAIYEIPPDMWWGQIEQAARAVRQLLAVTESPTEASAMFAPQYDSFYWDAASLSHSERIWT